MSDSSQQTFDYARYLAAKENLDARSINRNVWDVFAVWMQQHQSGVIHLLEVGAGIGATFKRVVSLDLQADLAYTLLDNEEQNLSYFSHHIDPWLESNGFVLISENIWRAQNGFTLEIRTELSDLYKELELQTRVGRWDVIVGQAFLDLFDIEAILPKLLAWLRSGGVFYFPINFDGITSFVPSIDKELDDLIEEIYHQSMDRRAAQPELKGHSQSGRMLLSELIKLGHKLMSVGASDWLVYPENGDYQQMDKKFLIEMLGFVGKELKKSNEISNDVARQWLDRRHQQLEKKELIFLAHQIDILGSVA